MNPEPDKSTIPEQEPVLTDEDRLLAILAYVPVLCLIPYLRKDRSDFVSGHVQLGMTLFVVEIFAMILRFRFIWDIIILACIVAALIGIFHVVQGRGFYLPYLSDLFSRK